MHIAHKSQAIKCYSCQEEWQKRATILIFLQEDPSPLDFNEILRAGYSTFITFKNSKFSVTISPAKTQPAPFHLPHRSRLHHRLFYNFIPTCSSFATPCWPAPPRGLFSHHELLPHNPIRHLQPFLRLTLYAL